MFAPNLSDWLAVTGHPLFNTCWTFLLTNPRSPCCSECRDVTSVSSHPRVELLPNLRQRSSLLRVSGAENHVLSLASQFETKLGIIPVLKGYVPKGSRSSALRWRCSTQTIASSEAIAAAAMNLRPIACQLHASIFTSKHEYLLHVRHSPSLQSVLVLAPDQWTSPLTHLIHVEQQSIPIPEPQSSRESMIPLLSNPCKQTTNHTMSISYTLAIIA